MSRRKQHQSEGGFALEPKAIFDGLIGVITSSFYGLRALLVPMVCTAFAEYAIMAHIRFGMPSRFRFVRFGLMPRRPFLPVFLGFFKAPALEMGGFRLSAIFS